MRVPSQVREQIVAAIESAGGITAVLAKTLRDRGDGVPRPVCSSNMLEKFKYGFSALGPKTVAELREVLTDVSPELWLAAMGAEPTAMAAEANP